MAVNSVKSLHPGMMVVKSSLGLPAALGSISVVAFPYLKAVGGSLLGAAARFAWPVTLGFAGALVIVAIIAFVAFKILSGSKERETVDKEAS